MQSAQKSSAKAARRRSSNIAISRFTGAFPAVGAAIARISYIRQVYIWSLTDASARAKKAPQTLARLLFCLLLKAMVGDSYFFLDFAVALVSA
jgi:hypothetical protein